MRIFHRIASWSYYISVWLMSYGLMLLFAETARSDDLTALATSGNRSSVEMIRSYYADVEQTVKEQAKEWSRSARYWRTATSLRAVEQTRPGVVTDVTRRVGSQHVVTIQNGKVSGKNEQAFGVVISVPTRRVLETDPWEYGLFFLPLGLVTNPPKVAYSLDEAVRNGTVRESGWVKEGGRRLAHILLDCDAGDRTYEVWVDPEVNWMIRKCVQTMREKGSVTWKNEYRVNEFGEPKPSIFLPLSCTSTLEFRGKIVAEMTVVMKNVRVNEVLPPEPSSPIPSGGTRAFDEAAGTTYVINKDGNRIGPTIPINTDYSHVGAPATEDPLAPASSSFWLGWLAIAMGFVAAAVGVTIRRRRSARNQLHI